MSHPKEYRKTTSGQSPQHSKHNGPKPPNTHPAAGTSESRSRTRPGHLAGEPPVGPANFLWDKYLHPETQQPPPREKVA